MEYLTYQSLIFLSSLFGAIYCNYFWYSYGEAEKYNNNHFYNFIKYTLFGFCIGPIMLHIMPFYTAMDIVKLVF